MSRDSCHTYIHLSHSRTADLFEEFTRTHLAPEEIYVAPNLQPPNPEDEDDVVPDQHAAFGITRVMGEGGTGGLRVGGGSGDRRGGGGGARKGEIVWRDLGLEETLERGPSVGLGGVGGVEDEIYRGGIGTEGRNGAAATGSGGRAFGGFGGGRRMEGTGEEQEQPIALAIRDKKRADDVRAGQ